MGGVDKSNHSCTGQLFTLKDDKWSETRYPPLEKPCSSPAVVSLISDPFTVAVIDGRSVNHVWTTSVNILSDSKWKCGVPLPERLSYPSAAVCDDTLYVIGDGHLGYSQPLHSLLQGDNPNTSPSESSPIAKTWTRLPRLPRACSTASSLCGQFVVVGGKEDESGKESAAIDQLMMGGEFVEAGCMCLARCYCCVARHSRNEIMVVGGMGENPDPGRSVELCYVR